MAKGGIGQLNRRCNILFRGSLDFWKMTNQEKIEHYWDDHALNDTGWLALLDKNATSPLHHCEHKNISVKDFNQWFCETCGKIATYDDLRK
jgi:hypothetical protein